MARDSVHEQTAVLDALPHSGEYVERGRGTVFTLYEPSVDLRPHKLPLRVYVGLQNINSFSFLKKKLFCVFFNIDSFIEVKRECCSVEVNEILLVCTSRY